MSTIIIEFNYYLPKTRQSSARKFLLIDQKWCETAWIKKNWVGEIYKCTS